MEILQQEYLYIWIAGISAFIALLALIFAIIANGKYKRLNRRYDYFMRGRDGETLEDYFVDLQGRIEELEEEDQKNKEMIRTINRNIRASFQKVGIVKYNAFGKMGGNMSFALAILDYTNSGFVINSVYSREGCFLFIKDVDAGTTSVELGSEEKLALEQALGYKESM